MVALILDKAKVHCIGALYLENAAISSWRPDMISNYKGSPGYKGSPDYKGSPGYKGSPDYKGSPGYKGSPDYKGNPDHKGWSQDYRSLSTTT